MSILKGFTLWTFPETEPNAFGTIPSDEPVNTENPTVVLAGMELIALSSPRLGNDQDTPHVSLYSRVAPLRLFL
jgi:hypothetical protein